MLARISTAKPPKPTSKPCDVAPGSAESSVAFVDFALTRFASMSELLRSSGKGLAAEYRLRALALGEG